MALATEVVPPNPFPGVNWTVVTAWGTAASVISILSSVAYIIIFYRLRRRVNNIWNRIVLQMEIEYVLGCSVALLTEIPVLRHGVQYLLNPDHRTLCKAQATLVQWIMPVEVILNIFLVISLYLRVTSNVRTEKAEPYVCAAAWLAPGIFAIILLLLDSYAPAGAWCWIGANTFLLRLGALYIEVWVGFAVVLAGAVGVVLYVKRNVRDLNSQPETLVSRTLRWDYYKKTSFYPITYVISWLPSTINRVLEGINRSLINSTAPWAAQLFSVQLGGFLYFVAFVYNNWHILTAQTDAEMQSLLAKSPSYRIKRAATGREGKRATF